MPSWRWETWNLFLEFFLILLLLLFFPSFAIPKTFSIEKYKAHVPAHGIWDNWPTMELNRDNQKPWLVSVVNNSSIKWEINFRIQHYKHMSFGKLSPCNWKIVSCHKKNCKSITVVDIYCSFTKAWQLPRSSILVVQSLDFEIYEKCFEQEISKNVGDATKILQNYLDKLHILQKLAALCRKVHWFFLFLDSCQLNLVKHIVCTMGHLCWRAIDGFVI